MASFCPAKAYPVGGLTVARFVEGTDRIFNFALSMVLDETRPAITQLYMCAPAAGIYLGALG